MSRGIGIRAETPDIGESSPGGAKSVKERMLSTDTTKRVSGLERVVERHYGNGIPTSQPQTPAVGPRAGVRPRVTDGGGGKAGNRSNKLEAGADEVSKTGIQCGTTGQAGEEGVPWDGAATSECIRGPTSEGERERIQHRKTGITFQDTDGKHAGKLHFRWTGPF